MFWTWDRYRAETGKWQHDAEESRQQSSREPFAHFLIAIDLALYGAVAAFAACVAAIVLR